MKTNFYFYKVYGLNVKSQIKIEELVVLDDKHRDDIDVNIYLDTMPQNIKNSIEDGSYQAYTQNNMWFKGGEEAIFNVVDGNKIVIETIEGYDKPMLKIYLMGIAFAMLMIQREKVSIHGGSIDLNGKGILIVGESGAGKTTLTTAFRSKGYKLLSDDMSSLDNLQNGQILINPSFPMQRIDDDVIEKLGYNKENYKKIYLSRQKYLVSTHSEFQYNDTPLRAVFHLSEGDGDNVEINEVKGSEKISLILRSIFRVAILGQIGIPKGYFNKCLEIAKNIPVYKISRPKNILSTNSQISLIESIMQSI